MTPKAFPEATVELKRPPDMTEKECGSLYVFQGAKLGQSEPYTISCWKMTWRERIAAFFYGHVWVWVHAGGETQPPIAVMAQETPFEHRRQ